MQRAFRLSFHFGRWVFLQPHRESLRANVRHVEPPKNACFPNVSTVELSKSLNILQNYFELR